MAVTVETEHHFIAKAMSVKMANADRLVAHRADRDGASKLL
jgi:hypothetical protein